MHHIGRWTAALGLAVSVSAHAQDTAVTFRVRLGGKLASINGTRVGDFGTGAQLTIAQVTAIGKRVRIDFTAMEPRGRNIPFTDYILMTEDGKVLSVSPTTRSYRDGAMMTGGLPGIASALSRAVEDIVDEFDDALNIDNAKHDQRENAKNANLGGQLNGFPVIGVSIKTDSLGAGDVIDGRPTKQYRMTVLGQAMVYGDYRPMRLVIDIATADVPQPIANPFEPFGRFVFGTTTKDALDLLARLDSARARLPGKVVRTTTTMSLVELTAAAARKVGHPVPPDSVVVDAVQTMQVTNISSGPVEHGFVDLPPGFTKATGGG